LSPGGDGDKALLLGTQSYLLASSSSYLSYGENNYANLSGYMAYGLGAEEWGGLGGLYYGGNGAIQAPGLLGANPIDSKYMVLPLFVFRAGTVVTPGGKGQANLLRWKPASGMNYGDTVYDGTDYYVVVDDVMLRGWPDATGPMI
jgi:hypothetical protein